jgi:hypothetical protein
VTIDSAIRMLILTILTSYTRHTAFERLQQSDGTQPQMIGRIEEWLGRMRETCPGSNVRVTASDRGRDLGWVFDVTDKTDTSELAETIEKTCCDAGVIRCDLRAESADGHFAGQLVHKVDPPAQIVSTNATLAVPAAIEDIVEHALQTSRSFAGLGFKAIVKNHEVALHMIDRLDKQVAALTKENTQLRERLSSQWEIADKLHTHQLDDHLAKDKAERQGRIAETLVHATMARLFGKGTPEAETIEMRMARAFLRSLSDDQLQKIAAILSEDQRIALFELIRGANQNSAHVNGVAPSPTDAHAAAEAAAGTNAKTGS